VQVAGMKPMDDAAAFPVDSALTKRSGVDCLPA
jgi:hypothetical protein